MFLYCNEKRINEVSNEEEAFDLMLDMEDLFESLELKEFSAQMGEEWEVTYLLTSEGGLENHSPAPSYGAPDYDFSPPTTKRPYLIEVGMDDFLEYIDNIDKGNPGGLSLLCRMSKEEIDGCKKKGLTGSAIWSVFKDKCGEDWDQFSAYLLGG